MIACSCSSTRPVLTLGRHADERHVLADAAELGRRGIEVIRVERGGEVTYHGPGQLVAYPILGLADRGLLLRPLVRALEAAMVATCAAFGVAAGRRDGHPGLLVRRRGPAAAQDRGARDPRRARRQLPRDRPERRPGPRRLRPHRSLRRARPRVDVDRRGAASVPTDETPATAADAVARAAELFAAGLAEQLDAPLACDSPPAMAATA